MNKDDRDEIYGVKAVPKQKKKKYTGFSWIVNKKGEVQTNKAANGITVSVFKKEYKPLRMSFRVHYEFELV